MPMYPLSGFKFSFSPNIQVKKKNYASPSSALSIDFGCKYPRLFVIWY